MKHQPQPKEVDEFAETEVLDRRTLEPLENPDDFAPAAAYEEYSRLLASEAVAPQQKPAPKGGNKRSR